MAKYDSHSSNRTKPHQLVCQSPQASILASCYSVKPATSVVSGFHYCTMPGAALQELSGIPEVPSGSTPSSSPPLDSPITYSVGDSAPGDDMPGYNGEAAHTIQGECERLFCDTLAATFLGGKKFARQESLGMGAYRSTQAAYTAPGYGRIELWLEVWDYVSDAIYRGFVTGVGDERTLFVFLGDGVEGHGLKSGLIALFELAGMPALDCSEIVVCVRRSGYIDDMDAARSLGWCGFGLTTLEPWALDRRPDSCISSEWLFLSAEV